MTVTEYIVGVMRKFGFKTQNPEIPALAYGLFTRDFRPDFLDFSETYDALIYDFPKPAICNGHNITCYPVSAVRASCNRWASGTPIIIN